MNFSRQENHRVYFQRYLPPASTGLSPLSFSSSSSSAQNNNDGDGHRLVTSSAAIRLTDAATAEHVTSLLHKKFGLESNYTQSQSGKMKVQVKHKHKISRDSKSKQKMSSRYFYGDALILVGTLHHLPREHLEYHHEERYHRYPSIHQTNNVNVTSTNLSKNRNLKGDASSATSSHTMTTHSTTSTNSNPLSNSDSTSAATTGLSHQKNADQHMNNSSLGEKAENINVVRTLLPHENPLVVRDEMLAHLYQRQYEFLPDNISSKANNSNENQKQSHSNQRLQKVEQMLKMQRLRSKIDESSNMANKKKNRLGGVNVSMRWFYQPDGGGKFDVCDTDLHHKDSSDHTYDAASPTVLNMDGYFSAMDDSSSDESDSEMKRVRNGKYENVDTYDDKNSSEEATHKASPLHLIDRQEWNSDSFYYDRFGSAPHVSKNFFSMDYSSIHPIEHSTSDQNVKPSPPTNANSLTEYHNNIKFTNEIKNRSHLIQVRSPSSNNHCVSGYLLKRSKKDPNVWRKMYCTLTDDRFWFVSRIKRESVSSSNAGGSSRKQIHPRRSAKHFCIRLSHAYLKDPKTKPSSSKSQPKSRLSSFGPIHLLQISAQNGKTYTFCAHNRKAHQYWMQEISTRIASCKDNTLMEFAELIVEEEEDARTNRMKMNAMKTCWDCLKTTNKVEFDETDSDRKDDKDKNCYAMVLGQKWYDLRSIKGERWWWKELIRLAMLVQEFREVCRHFISFGRFFVGATESINKSEIERWRFDTKIQWEAAAAVCLSKCYSNMSLSGEERNENGNVFHHDDGGQLGEIGANIESFVYDQLRKVNSKNIKDIVSVEAPPIDLFDSVMKKIVVFETDERTTTNDRIVANIELLREGNIE